MVIKHASNLLKFLRTTAIGGLLFLLPLVVIGALVGQIVPIVMAIAESLGGVLPVFLKTASGLALLVVLSIAILLMLCFVAGLLARRSFVSSLSRAFEKKLVLFFPRYAILKDQMADSIGGDENQPRMKPVLVRFDEAMRIAFETERDEASKLSVVYLPGSPDPWSGKVVIVDIDRVQSLDTEFGIAAATCEQLGRGSMKLIQESSNA